MRLDIEFEAHPAVEVDRQARDNAGHRDIAFVRERQRVGHAELCPHPGVGKSGQQGTGASKQPQRSRREPHITQRDRDHNSSGQPDQQQRTSAKELGLPLKDADPGHEGRE